MSKVVKPWENEQPNHHPRFKCSKAAMKDKVAKAEGKPTKSLAEWVREARECNLDYGTYRGLVEQCGMTFAEIKAQNRSVSGHSRVRARKTI